MKWLYRGSGCTSFLFVIDFFIDSNYNIYYIKLLTYNYIFKVNIERWMYDDNTQDGKVG